MVVIFGVEISLTFLMTKIAIGEGKGAFDRGGECAIFGSKYFFISNEPNCLPDA